MEQNLFVNENGKQFAGRVRKGIKTYKKNVKFFVNVYNGFGIDADLLDDVVSKGYQSITFVVKEDLVNYRKMDSRGRYQVVCSAGEYKISLEDFMSKGRKDTLNPKHGKQWFINVNFTQKVG